jgi:cell division protein FtsZ
VLPRCEQDRWWRLWTRCALDGDLYRGSRNLLGRPWTTCRTEVRLGQEAGFGTAVRLARVNQERMAQVHITGATGVLFNVAGPRDLGLRELDAAARVIASVVDPEAEIIFGTSLDDSLKDEVRITVIATGFSGVKKMNLRQVMDEADPEPIKLGEIRADPTASDSLTEADLPTFLRRSFPTR